jgi:hypothetical protein
MPRVGVIKLLTSRPNPLTAKLSNGICDLSFMVLRIIENSN